MQELQDFEASLAGSRAYKVQDISPSLPFPEPPPRGTPNAMTEFDAKYGSDLYRRIGKTRLRSIHPEVPWFLPFVYGTGSRYVIDQDADAYYGEIVIDYTNLVAWFKLCRS